MSITCAFRRLVSCGLAAWSPDACLRAASPRQVQNAHHEIGHLRDPSPLRYRRIEVIGMSESQAYDVLVIGGGATGAGVLRDLARRGLRSLLVERGD